MKINIRAWVATKHVLVARNFKNKKIKAKQRKISLKLVDRKNHVFLKRTKQIKKRQPWNYPRQIFSRNKKKTINVNSAFFKLLDLGNLNKIVNLKFKNLKD